MRNAENALTIFETADNTKAQNNTFDIFLFTFVFSRRNRLADISWSFPATIHIAFNKANILISFARLLRPAGRLPG